MSQLSIEAKEAILLKVLNRGSDTVDSIARANNVPLSTLHLWLRSYREGKPLSNRGRRSTVASGLTSSDQFNHVIATHNLDEVSLGKYCR
jgi:transposase-like protein